MRSERAGPIRAEPWSAGRPIVLEGVGVRRGDRVILEGVDLLFEPGRRHVLVGPSGAGKSTLLRLLDRLDDPTSGSLRLGDRPYVALPVRLLRRHVGLVFQAPRPLPGTLADNLAYPSEIGRRPRPGRDDLERSLEEVGLDPAWLDRDATALSGGERQRLALAVALLAEPEVLLLDEPTSALDPASAQQVIDVLNRRAATGLRLVSVCHQRAHALALADEAVVLEAGRVRDRGPIAEVLARCDDGIWAQREAVGEGSRS